MRGGASMGALLILVTAAGIAAAQAPSPKDEWSQTFTGRILDVDLTPAGRAIVASADGLVTFTDEKGALRKQTGFLSPAVRITPDGLKAAAGRSSSIAMIDNAGATLWETALGGKVTGVGMDTEGKTVAAGADDKYVYLLNGATGAETAKVSVGEAPSGVATTGDRTAVGLPSGKVLLLDPTGNKLWEAAAGSQVHAVDLSSATVAVATEDRAVVVYNLAGEKQWSANVESPARAVATSADGSLVLAAAQAGDVFLYNGKGEFIWKLKSPSEVYTAVGLSAGGYFAAVGSREASVKVYRTNVSEAKVEGAAASPLPVVTPKPTPTPKTESEFLDQAVSTPSRIVLKAPRGPPLALMWTKLQQTVSGSAAEVTAAAVSPDGNTIVMASPKGLFFLDRSGNTVSSSTPFSSILTLVILQLEFSRDGQQRVLVSGCESGGGVHIESIYSATGSQLWTSNVSSSTCQVGGVRMSADGKAVVNISTTNPLNITWLDSSFKPRARDNLTVVTTLPAFKHFDLSPDGKLLAVGYGNKTVEVYNDSAFLAKHEGFNFNVDALRFTPDGKLAVLSGPDVTLLDVSTAQASGTMTVAWKKRVEQILAWDRMSDGIAAGTNTNDVVWVKAGTDIVNKKMDGYVDGVDISANGKFLAASSRQAYKAWLFADDGRTLWEKDNIPEPRGVSVADDGSVLVYANPPGTTATAGTLYHFPMPTLDVDSSPSGSKVKVDDEEVGTTPIRIQGLSPGNHTVTVSYTGYKECAGTVNVTGKAQRVCLHLALAGTSPPPETPAPSPTAAAGTSAPATAAPTAAPSSPAPTTAAASPSPTPKKSPGFEALFALAALGAVAVVVRKRQT